MPGELIDVRVTAINSYGESEMSDIGSGALLMILPDPPQNLVNNEAVTDAGVIRIDWEEGASDGGTPVIDQRVWWAVEGEAYVILEAAYT